MRRLPHHSNPGRSVAISLRGLENLQHCSSNPVLNHIASPNTLQCRVYIARPTQSFGRLSYRLLNTDFVEQSLVELPSSSQGTMFHKERCSARNDVLSTASKENRGKECHIDVPRHSSPNIMLNNFYSSSQQWAFLGPN